MKFSIYNNLLTRKKTWFIASVGEFGNNTYNELQVVYNNKQFQAVITDGYKYKKYNFSISSLKQAIEWFKQQIKE